ncbi:DUF4870 domain-containing protein [Georgenia phoenicis]|uniref:DUF4870 domain-containing protein n=1 Tax=unclassified Georgenia TaxID=2626815 RepID=UPI0039AFA74A
MSTTPDFGDDPQRPSSGGPGPGQSPYGHSPYEQPAGPYGQSPYGAPADPYGQQQPPYPPYGNQLYGQAPYANQPYGQQPSADDRTIAVIAHLSPLAGIVLSVGTVSWLAPLIVWFVWRDRGPLIRNAAASAFNFNLTVWIVGVIAFVCFVTVFLIPVALVLWAGAFIAQLVLSIRGAIAANRGEVYRYPLQVPILR